MLIFLIALNLHYLCRCVQNILKMSMNFIEQAIKGVWVIEPVRYGDNRGYFCETFKKEEFEAAIGKVDFIQDNE